MPLTLSEALNLLESGQLVSLRYITVNTSKGTGGKEIEVARLRLAQQQGITKAAVAPAPAKDYSEGKTPITATTSPATSSCRTVASAQCILFSSPTSMANPSYER